MHLFATHFGTYEVDRRDDGSPRLRPFRHDPDPSPTGAAYLDMADNPARILQPMVRRSMLERPDAPSGHLRGRESFVPVDWATALDLVADRLEAVRTRHGNSSIYAGSYGWASAGRFHHAQSQLKRFLNLVGGFTGSVHSYSYGTAGPLIPHLVGPEYDDAGECAPSWDGIAAHCRLMLAFGGLRMSNAQVQAGGGGAHRSREWVERALANGMRMVVFSASRDDMPASGVDFVPIRPNSDTAVMLAMAYVLLEEGQADLAFMDRCTSGYDRYVDHLMGREDGVAKTPEWAQSLSGVPAPLIRDLARDLAAQPSLINVAWSLQRARFGELPYQAALGLACLAGHVGQPGCGFAFGLTAVGSVGQPVRYLKGPSVSQGPNPVRHFIPVGRITELLERPGGTIDYNGRTLDLPDIRMIWWVGGNPYHHHQDLGRLRRAWERPDTVIVHEPVWTATARLADIVLPATFPFERNDVAACSRDNWIVASRQVQPPPPLVWDDHAIFIDLAARFGVADAFTEGLGEQQWIARLYDGYRERYPDLPPFDAFWDRGFAALDEGQDAPASWALLGDFVADPAGHPLSTPSGRIEVQSDVIAGFGYDDCPGHPVWRAPEEWLGSPLAQRFPLHLLSPQPAHRLHNQLEAAGPSRKARVAGREPVTFNRQDAQARGIGDGDVVMLYNDRGRVLAGAILSDAVMPGVCILATGATWNPVEDDAGGSIDRSGNPNVLTADIGSSRLSQGPSPGSCLVQAMAWQEEEE